MEDERLISNVAKATRQELMDSYRALLKKYKDLADGANTGEQKQIFDKVAPYKGESDITQSITSTRVTLQTALAEVETKLVAKFTELKQFDEAVTVQKGKLKELYDIETAAGALIALLQAKEEVKRQTENDKIEVEQKRKRDEEEYKFNLELQKRKDKEAFETERRVREIDLRAKENVVIEKQQALASKEGELASLQQQVSEFPGHIEQQRQQLETNLKLEWDKDKQTTILLLQKESEAQKTVYEGRIKSLETMIEEQRRLIGTLQDQLKASQAQLQEVVLKSIEGASGAKTLDVVNKLALEQTRASANQR